MNAADNLLVHWRSSLSNADEQQCPPQGSLLIHPSSMSQASQTLRRGHVPWQRKSLVSTIGDCGRREVQVSVIPVETSEIDMITVLVLYLFGTKRTPLILFVCKNQKQSILQFIFFKHGMQLLSSYRQTFFVGAISYNVNNICVLAYLSTTKIIASVFG